MAIHVQGLGRAMASALYCSGAIVIINGRDTAKTKAAAVSIHNEAVATGLLSSELGHLIPIAGDVSEPEVAQALVEETVRRCGGVDILVNNAGINAAEAPAEDCSLDTWQRVQKVNVDGPYLLSHAALPHIKRSQAGRIVNVGSIGGHVVNLVDLVA